MKKQITIATSEGDKHGEADVSGGLAIHNEWSAIEKGFGTPVRRITGYSRWQITHVRTGYKLPGYFYTKKHALKARKLLLEIMDWEEIESPKKARELPLEVREKIKKAVTA